MWTDYTVIIKLSLSLKAGVEKVRGFRVMQFLTSYACEKLLIHYQVKYQSMLGFQEMQIIAALSICPVMQHLLSLCL